MTTAITLNSTASGMKTKPYPAILLVGPTGSGKTPLGALCEKKGLWQSRVFHFDFGAILRRIAAAGPGSNRMSASSGSHWLPARFLKTITFISPGTSFFLMQEKNGFKTLI
jgi:hypothetical protein